MADSPSVGADRCEIAGALEKSLCEMGFIKILCCSL